MSKQLQVEHFAQKDPQNLEGYVNHWLAGNPRYNVYTTTIYYANGWHHAWITYVEEEQSK